MTAVGEQSPTEAETRVRAFVDNWMVDDRYALINGYNVGARVYPLGVTDLRAVLADAERMREEIQLLRGIIDGAETELLSNHWDKDQRITKALAVLTLHVPPPTEDER